MKPNRKNTLFVVSLLGLASIALAACGNSSGNSSAQESSAPAATSSDRGTTYIEATIQNNAIPSGGNFFDFCKPSVIYHNGDAEPIEVFDYTQMTEYKIVDLDDSTKTYKAGDPLPSGNYRCNIRFLRGKPTKDSVDFTVEDITPAEASEGNGFKTYSLADLEDLDYKHFKKIDTLNGGSMPSEGDSKVLVIPVQFDNIQFPDPDLARSVINEAFFGKTEDTPWESLASYYKKSSYGRQNITGVVTPVYTYHHNDTEDVGSSIAATITSEAVDYFKKNGDIVATDFDSDKDGFIDGVEIIYITTNPTPSSGGSDTWWNYTTNLSTGANVSSPNPHRIFWSRWDYLTQKYYATSEKGILVDSKKVDPHTIIHETGHMMGAPDYYSYAHDEGPAGCVDMMDCNVGDHNAYTKMQYGWVAPKVIDGSNDNFTLTLHSFTETGEFVLLRNTEEDPWNRTPFDEYLVLQYYTPTGLNKMDHEGYGEWKDAVSSDGRSAYGHAGTYGHPGLQVFHADGRVVSNQGTLKDGDKGEASPVYTDEPRNKAFEDSEKGIYGSEAYRTHGNTGSAEPNRASQAVVDGELTADTAIRELSIILPSGVNSFTGNSYYSNMGNMANLFGLNGVDLGGWTGNAEASGADDKFGGSSYSNYKMAKFYPNTYFFNDGTSLNWSFEVVAQTVDSITIHFLNSNI